MALRIHAQMMSDPAATDLLYWTCPFNSFVSSRIFVCNQGASGLFRLGIKPVVYDALQAVNWIYFDEAIAGTTTFAVPSGITMERGDAMYIRGNNATMSFTLFGEGIGDEG